MSSFEKLNDDLYGYPNRLHTLPRQEQILQRHNGRTQGLQMDCCASRRLRLVVWSQAGHYLQLPVGCGGVLSTCMCAFYSNEKVAAANGEKLLDKYNGFAGQALSVLVRVSFT